ncbi:unnamed protein product [Spirodela intermedia]|uniref:Uncharacterized protein n=1 Tax=Spirodela intermedia TaxID=51605 RepID=A0A7I8J9V1_SPIIN|nr:unnamed protein product [Spirodela intermedia]CAA6666869.1 unnamed protein product [Spirodela intermedia]
MENDALLRRYRRERRRLLEFILSAGLAFIDVDLDVVSADYVLERVKSGGMLDLSKASERYQDELRFPVMISSRTGITFFLNSKPEFSGPPPQRNPPQANLSSHQASFAAEQSEQKSGRDCTDSRIPNNVHCTATTFTSYPPLKDTSSISFGLPTLSTGLSDDDLRATAYEVLVASVLIFGGHAYFHEDKQKEKKSRFLTGLRAKRDRTKVITQSVDWHSEILDMIRVQMEISEAMDACIKRGVMLFHSTLTSERIDVPQIMLELLSNVKKSGFVNEKLFTQWQLKKVNILEELLCGSVDVVTEDEYAALKLSISGLRNISGRSDKTDSAGQDNILMTIRNFVSRLSNVPGKFGLPGETCYWTSSYHCHVKLYEKLLVSVFDILEDGEIVEESEEFLSIFKLTWPVLGITQKLHDVLYGWVLLQQYILTGETTLLKNAVIQIRKAVSSEDVNRNEEAYMNCLLCFNGGHEGHGDLSLVQAVLSSYIKVYVKCYYMQFSDDIPIIKPDDFVSAVNLAAVLVLHFGGERYESKFGMDISKTETAPELMKGYIESSISAACERDLKLTADTEFITFTPVLSQWYPEAGIVSAVFLHKLYGKYLMPFLESVSDISGGPRSVLTAADILERCLNDMLYSCGEEGVSFLASDLHPYKIGLISRPLILQWVNSQHDNLLKWAGRAILIEDWEPLSSQQRLAASIVENVEQFFNFHLPMDIIHLRSLLIGIFQSLDTYLLQMGNKFVDKKHLYPSVPALTRYKEETGLFTKKKPTELAVQEENVIQLLDGLTTSKLCIRLNTLHYIRVQIDIVEDSIKKLWKQIHPVEDQFSGDPGGGLDGSAQSIEELFTIFDEIRKTSFNMSDEICDFIGPRLIFWDLRDSFIISLYSGNVEHARLDIVIQQLDSILNQICDWLIDTLRDRVISSICRASMEGYAWVLSDGGPSRAFSEVDVSMLQEDLNMLKELFVASGEGLPRSDVEKEAKLIQQILEICGLKTGTIIEMLMSSSEHISLEPDAREPGRGNATDADTLLRILCHRKDREASKFLKKHYHLPKSSDYDETPGRAFVSKSPLITDIINRSTSARWTEKGQKSFRTMKQRFREAASEIKYSPW